MSATLANQQLPETTNTSWGDNDARFGALCNFIEYGQGHFSFALAEFDLPSLRTETLDKLRARFPQLNVVEVELFPPPPDAPEHFGVLDQLSELVELYSPQRPPDALIITGLEKLYPTAIAHPTSHEAGEELARAFQPLNLGRNVLAQQFDCPVLLCLPPAAMSLFLMNAPDINSWRSGYFSFQSDLDALRKEAKRIAALPANFVARREWRRRSREELRTESEDLARLLDDVKELPRDQALDAETLARLQYHQGWLGVALNYRQQALESFAATIRLTRNWLLRIMATRAEAAAKLIRASAALAPERLAELRRVFRGAAALTEEEGVFGREKERDRLINQVTKVGTRFLTIWGETGCGKTSLVMAGLLPELKAAGNYLPVIVRQWDAPIENIRRALEQATRQALGAAAAEFSFADLTSLQGCLQRATAKTGKKVVIICDQFEQFFDQHPQRGDRRRIIKEFRTPITDYRIECQFLFLVRADELGRMVEFEGKELSEPLGQAARFDVPLFSAADATRVLHELKAQAALEWSDKLIQAVVTDLTSDEQVRPIKLQLVAASLATSDITTDSAYARAGGADALLDDYLQLTLTDLTSDRSNLRDSKLQFARKALAQFSQIASGLRLATKATLELEQKAFQETMKVVLLALVDDPPRRIALTQARIAERTGLSPWYIRESIRLLVKGHLVREAESYADEPLADADKRYELTHDFLVDSVLRITRGLQDKRRQANRTLKRALEDLVYHPFLTLGFRQWWLVKNYADPMERQKPPVKKLLLRSLLWRTFSRLVLPVLGVIAALFIIQNSSGHVTIEQDFNDRVVVRRGLPYLGFLPFIGNDILLDTGFNASDLKPEERKTVQNIIHWEWKNLQSGAYAEDKLVNILNSLPAQGQLLCKIGLFDAGLNRLADAIGDPSGNVRSAAASTLAEVVKAQPSLASPTQVQALIVAIKDSRNDDPIGDARSAAASALAEVLKAQPSLASPTQVQALFKVINDSRNDPNGYWRGEAAAALAGVVKAQPSLASPTLQLLLEAMKDSRNDPNGYVRRAAASALAEVLKAQPSLASPTQVQTLIVAIKDSRNDPKGYVRRAAASTLADVLKAQPSLASQMQVQALFEALKNSRNDPNGAVRRAVAEVLKAQPSLASPTQVQALLVAIKDSRNDPNGAVRSAAASALAEVLKAQPSLASPTQVQALLVAIKDARDDLPNDGRRAAASALAEVLKAQPSLASPTLQLLLEAMKDSRNDPNGAVRRAAASTLAEVLKAQPSLASQTQVQALLEALKDSRNDPNGAVRRAAALALAEVLQAQPSLASQTQVQALLEALKDSRNYPDGYVRGAAASALAEVLKAQPSLASQTQVQALLEALKDSRNDPDGYVRGAAASALAEIAQVNSGAKVGAFDWLTRHDRSVRDGLTRSLPDLFVFATKTERDPVQFFFDHLEGRQSWMKNGGNANTYAIYRNLIVTAMARWLALNKPGLKASQEALQKRLEAMRASDKRLHLRIAAWDALAQAETLKKERSQNNEDE